jgi:hypothetical protein
MLLTLSNSTQCLKELVFQINSLLLVLQKNYGRITQDEYDKKAIELKQRQYELNDKFFTFELKKPFDVLLNLQSCRNCSNWPGRGFEP